MCVKWIIKLVSNNVNASFAAEAYISMVWRRDLLVS